MSGLIGIVLVGCGMTRTPTKAPTVVLTEATIIEPTDEPLLEGPPADASLGETWTRPADGMVMSYIPGGDFEMGSYAGDDDEQPIHTVTLDSFWIDQNEVTTTQYERCVDAGACKPRLCGKPNSSTADNGDMVNHNFPAICVNWYQAETYCRWAEARLPTEAEWEYAARGPENMVFPWGDEFDGARLNYCDKNCERDWADETFDDGYTEIAPVRSYPSGASWCGALDMAGNAWEWVADWYGSDYYSRSPVQNPPGPASGEGRVLRGGSWGFDPFYVRSANRDTFLLPSNTYGHLGFRCARGAD
jgi:formylglycine-generating enzyme required for sulfatase activity